jgi:predicted transcriptional regulator
MPESIEEMLREDLACESLLECFHGLRELDREVFGVLTEAEDAMTVDEVAERVDRERSTAYRSVQRLREAGFVEREQVNYEQGGYYHVFRPRPPSEVTGELQRMLNDWYAKMGQLIHEFQEKYEERPAAPEPSR